MIMIQSAWILSRLVVALSLVVWSEPVTGFNPEPPNSNHFLYHHVSNITVLENCTTSSVEETNSSSRRRISLNHFTTIGIPITSTEREEFIKQQLELLGDRSNFYKMSVPGLNGCYYLIQKSKSGAQLWGTLENEDVFCGFDPHFEGKSRIQVCIVIRKPQQYEEDGTDEGILDGSFIAVPDVHGDALKFILKESDATGSMSFRGSTIIVPRLGTVYAGFGFMNPDTRESYITIEFDCPNFGCLGKERTLPVMCTIQLSAFAEEITTYSTVEEYESLKDKNSVTRDGKEIDISLASQCFICGSFSSKEKEGYAYIVGHVIETELRTNEISGESFYWSLIETAYGMKIDIVIHPTLLETRSLDPPQVGGIVQGYFWLSGLLLVDEK